MAETYCLTIGDPQGIGPEITAKLLRDYPIPEGQRLVIIGHLPTLEDEAHRLEIELPEPSEQLIYTNIQGNPKAESGAIAYMALEKGVELIHRGHAKALVTGPISKEYLKKSGIPYAGHTEILEAMARNYYKMDCQADMLFLYRAFRVLLLTRHVPLRQVSQKLNIPLVVRSLTNLVNFLQTHQGILAPRLCMLGVNPHAGEIGGEEERDILIPALQAISRSFNLFYNPPVAADGAFRGFDIDNVPFDTYIAPYHDQGLIPIKMIAGLATVNVTIGLPFLRTSVSHGMGYDIVGQGVADHSSLLEALKTAVSLRSQYS
jgi:4-hydroxythreonine-4-phosphate dehydrogenase